MSHKSWTIKVQANVWRWLERAMKLYFIEFLSSAVKRNEITNSVWIGHLPASWCDAVALYSFIISNKQKNIPVNITYLSYVHRLQRLQIPLLQISHYRLIVQIIMYLTCVVDKISRHWCVTRSWKPYACKNPKDNTMTVYILATLEASAVFVSIKFFQDILASASAEFMIYKKPQASTFRPFQYSFTVRWLFRNKNCFPVFLVQQLGIRNVQYVYRCRSLTMHVFHDDGRILS